MLRTRRCYPWWSWFFHRVRAECLLSHMIMVLSSCEGWMPSFSHSAFHDFLEVMHHCNEHGRCVAQSQGGMTFRRVCQSMFAWHGRFVRAMLMGFADGDKFMITRVNDKFTTLDWPWTWCLDFFFAEATLQNSLTNAVIRFARSIGIFCLIWDSCGVLIPWVASPD
jgi:hypothetical protein